MASFIVRRLRRGRKRRGHDSKIHGLTDAGIRLLAQKDFEALSMARIAREAGCSVGALYARFPEKHSYLRHLIWSAYLTLTERAETELEARRWRHKSLSPLVELIVEHVVSNMTTPRAAGVIRATAKLATVKPSTIELFEDYRATLTRLAVGLLSPRIRGNSVGAVKIGMQIVLATVTDAVLQPRPGPMAAGSRRMKQALTKVLAGYVGVSGRGGEAGDEADGEDDAVTSDSQIVSSKMNRDGTEVFDPDLRTIRRSALTSRRKGPISPSEARATVPKSGKADSPSPASAKAVTPPSIPKPPPEPSKPKVKRRLI